MYNQKLHLHFIGIGGVGMAGIAEIVSNLGYKVSGSDLRPNALSQHLERLGCAIHIGHKAENLSDTVTTVVKSSAIADSNIELVTAMERGITIISRAAMLAELMRMKYGIAVAGSHGKTTTTSMTAQILSEVGLDPTVVVGGRVLNQATGATLGMGSYFVAEADESDGSFTLLKPSIAVVTNIDKEHMGYYGDFETLKASFREFLSSVPFYGLVVACIDDPVVREVVKGVDRRILSYGLSEDADIRAHDIQYHGPKTDFVLAINGCNVADVSIPIAGEHMVKNALAAIGVGLELGAYPDEAVIALELFPGVSRRSEIIAEVGGVLIMDDYGHHPTEIQATLTAIRGNFLPHHSKKHIEGNIGRLHVLFEPHRYSRTQEVFEDFASVFSQADAVKMCEIYAAGETPIDGVSGRRLAESIDHNNVVYYQSFPEHIEEIASDLRPGDIVLTLGAGAIGKLGQSISQLLQLKAAA